MNLHVLAGLIVCMSGCVVTPVHVTRTLVPTGGSKADGTVELSYERAANEQANVNFAGGARAAIKRCRAWGYTGAERFGGEKSQCQFSNQYGCAQWLVTVAYQCTGEASPSSDGDSEHPSDVPAVTGDTGTQAPRRKPLGRAAPAGKTNSGERRSKCSSEQILEMLESGMSKSAVQFACKEDDASR